MKNNYRIDGNIVYIELNRKDGSKLETLIDLEDFEKVNEFTRTWSANYRKDIDNFYCQIHSQLNSGKETLKRLHRIIMGVDDPKIKVDHIYHNTLDNRKENLRLVTNQENSFNSKDAKGYYWHKRDKKWAAYIGINGKNIFLGGYNTEEEARNAYLRAKEIYHGINIEDKKSNEEIAEFEKKFIKEEPKGCCWDKNLNKWKAYIRMNKKIKHLGYYNTEEEARQVYLEAKENYNVINIDKEE